MIPESLRREKRWVIAKLEDRGGHVTKVPYCAFDPKRKASTTNPETWSDYETAAKTGELLGFVLGGGWVGIDLDHCINEGMLHPRATEIVCIMDSYTEVSVSGTGIHIICRGALPAGGRRSKGIEMYDQTRYFLITGQTVFGLEEVAERTDRLQALHYTIFGEPFVPSTSTTLEPINVSVEDEELIERLKDDEPGFEELWDGDLGRCDESKADFALCCVLARWTHDPERVDRLFRQSGLMRDKWERADYRERTVKRAMERIG